MIRPEKYNEVLDSGLLLDHYFVLSSIKNGEQLLNNKRIQGFVNLLEKKGYLEQGTITEKALELLDNVETAVALTTSEKSSKKQEDFSVWISSLHKKCQDKLFELTGARQVRDKIDKKSYPFLPNSVDLGKVLYKVITLYKIKDYEKIEKCILNYIEKCAQASNWFPILQYYIMKNNKSNLVTDCESGDDEPQEQSKSSQKFV